MGSWGVIAGHRRLWEVLLRHMVQRVLEAVMETCIDDSGAHAAAEVSCWGAWG